MANEHGKEVDDASYVIALGYSNVPQIAKENPVIVVGILTTKNLLDQLENVEFDRKENVVQRKNSLLELEKIAEDLSEYVLELRVRTIEYVQHPVPELKEVYSTIIRALTEGTLHQFEKSVVYVRKVLDYGFEERDILPDLPRSSTVIYCSKTTPNKFMRLARLLARLHYEREKSITLTNALDKVKKSHPNNFQVVRLRWNSPPVDDYNDLNVGPPFLVIKRPFAKHFETQSVVIGKKLAILPIARFCSGRDNDGDISECLHANGRENPYGALAVDSLGETCPDCSAQTRYLKCAYQRPACDGKSVACKNYAFSGIFCLGAHALYVTHFGDTLKVGTAFGSNAIGRLLEQGASSALILSPINGVKLASDLELAITQTLKEKYAKQKGQSKFNISKVVFRGPSNEYRLGTFLKEWHNPRTKLLEDIRNYLFSSPIQLNDTGVRLNKAHVDSSIALLTDCYENPGNLATFERKLKSIQKKSQRRQNFSGKIVGYRGSFVFLSDGNMLDLKALQGFVVEGQLE